MKTSLIAFVLLLAACGGRESVASKSAAAYREAQESGTAAGGGHEHGGHQAAPSPPVDHSAHATATTDAHAGHDMANADHAAHGTAEGGAGHATDHGAHTTTGSGDHSAMQHATPAAATDHGAHSTTTGAGDHSKMRHAAPSMDHSAHDTSHPPAQGAARDAATTAGGTPALHEVDDHSQHSASGRRGAGVTAGGTPPPLRSSDEMGRLDPAATLRADAFDAPAPVSVSEAAKAKEH